MVKRFDLIVKGGTLVDLAARREIRNDWIASKCGWTPYDGTTVTG